MILCPLQGMWLVRRASQGYRNKIIFGLPACRQAGLPDHGAFKQRLRDYGDEKNFIEKTFIIF